MKKIWIVLLAGLSIISACSPAPAPKTTGQGVGTIVASTLQAMTSAAPTPAAQPTAAPAGGIPVSYNNISFAIPLELNVSASSSTSADVEFPYINPSGGPMAGHVVFQITNYPVPGDAKIMIFKSSDFAAYGAPSQDAVTALLGKQEATQPLPKALVQGNFYAQAKNVSFKNGHGVRYLTQVLTNFAPITNKELFYYYQGVTNDGAYFVSAIFHVNAASLVADGSQSSVTPSDGVPFNWGADLDFQKYLGDITKKLNDAAPEKYTVSLTLLDNLIESVQINPQ